MPTPTPEAVIVKIDLHVGADWDGNDRHASVWATARDGDGNVSGYPIIGYTELLESFVVWNDDVGGWIELGKTADFAYGDWYKLMFDLHTNEIRFTVEGPTGATLGHSDTLTWGTKEFSNVIIQSYNYGEDYHVYWDNLEVYTPEPTTLALLGLGGLMLVRRRR